MHSNNLSVGDVMAEQHGFHVVGPQIIRVINRKAGIVVDPIDEHRVVVMYLQSVISCTLRGWFNGESCLFWIIFSLKSRHMSKECILNVKKTVRYMNFVNLFQSILLVTLWRLSGHV